MIGSAGGAGHAGLDVQDGTFRQEPGSGVCGQVQGSTVAVGNLDWVRSHSQTDAATAGSHHSSDDTGGGKHHTSADGTQHWSIHANSQNNSSSSDSKDGSSDTSSARATGQSDWQSGVSVTDGEQASSSGRSEAEGAGVMTVYVGVDGKLAGVFEMRDQLRPDAAATIRGLQRQGIDTILLSGTRLSMLCFAVLLSHVLCCAVLCCAALCFAALCCAALCCAVLCCPVLCWNW